MSSADGSSMGPYRLLRELGRGGMATVHEAIHPQLGRRVAVKQMLPALAGTPSAMARFAHEAKLAARLRHPHIVNVFDLGAHESVPYFVMDLVDGPTLFDLLDGEERLSLAHSVQIVLPVLSAVAACHREGIVHRDLKPRNVIVGSTPSGGVCPVIIDFGVAKDLHTPESPQITSAGVLVGTVGFMPPEQWKDPRDAEPASDQFAVGVILYQCLTGKMPFGKWPAQGKAEVAGVTRPSALNRELPPEIDDVILRALAADPADRYPTAHAFGAALVSFAEGITAQAWLDHFVRGDGSGVPSGGTLADTRHDDLRPTLPLERRAPVGLAAAILIAFGGGAFAGRWLASTRDRPTPAVAAGEAVALAAPPPKPAAEPQINAPPPVDRAVSVPAPPPLTPPPARSRAKASPRAASTADNSEGLRVNSDNYEGPRGNNGAPIVE